MITNKAYQMTITFLDPSNAPKPAANYSNVAIIPAEKKLLSISGQIGNDMEGNVAERLEAVSYTHLTLPTNACV